MELKNAVAVCLISLFSATLVALIARSLDSHAASQLQPQLAEIVEELRALRGQGGIAAAPTRVETVHDGLVVYYFHSNTRCPTCRSIESQAQETVNTHFASQLTNGEVSWQIVNYQQASAKPLTEKFDIQMPVVVLVRMKDGQVQDWKRLDKVWAVVGDKPAFTKYVREEIERMLSPDRKSETAAAQTPAPTIPAPSTDGIPAKEPPAIPIPQ